MRRPSMWLAAAGSALITAGILLGWPVGTVLLGAGLVVNTVFLVRMGRYLFNVTN